MIIVGSVIAVILVTIYLFPDETRKWWDRLCTAKELTFGIAGLIVAVFMIQSGNPWFMAIGLIGIIYGVMWMAFEKPYQAMIDVVRG